MDGHAHLHIELSPRDREGHPAILSHAVDPEGVTLREAGRRRANAVRRGCRPRTPRASNGREVACPSRARQTAEKRSAWFFMARSRFARFLPAPDMALVFVRCAAMTPGVWVRPAGLRPAAAPRSARRSPCAPPTRNLGCAHPARERPPTQGGACPALLGAAEHLLLSDGVTGVQRAPPAPLTLSPPRCGSSWRTRGHRGVPSSGACMGWRDGTR